MRFTSQITTGCVRRPRRAEVAPTAVFEGVSYVALGHLHSRQTSPTADPLQRLTVHSFGDRGPRGAWLIDLDAGGVRDVTGPVHLPVRQMSTITGRIADLLHDEQYDAVAEHWISAVITDPKLIRWRPEPAAGTVPALRTPGVSPEVTEQDAGLFHSHNASPASRTSVHRGFVHEMRGESSLASMEAALIGEAFEALRAQEARS